MGRRLIELRMPEGGAEHETVYETHHRCAPANALAREMGDDIDLIVFPVGNVGYGMPLNTAFAVQALGECDACGRLLTAMFVWRRGHVSHAGSLWTPDQG